mgnify:CR=1 FL=1
MDNQELQKDYKKLYEAEREKSEVLVSKIEECEKEIEELNFKLNRIKGSFAWKLATPLRKGLHFYEKTRDRLTRYGSIPGLMRKVRSKVQERKNMKRHGTASFPSPEEAKRQREAVFPDIRTGNCAWRTEATTSTRMWERSVRNTPRRIRASSTMCWITTRASRATPTNA